jgi:short-subunit dehydrogenase
MGEGGDVLRRVIDVNFTGAASICEALAAHMTPRGTGCIVGISSVAGDRGRQSNYVYGSAKGGFTLYLQGLRNRLFKQGVHVMTVKLGFVDTRMTFGMETGIPIASPEQVSRAVVAAADRKVDAFYYPHFWRGIMTVIRAVPEKVFKRLSL